MFYEYCNFFFANIISIVQILHKYYRKIVQHLCKNPTNFIQIFCNYSFKFCTNILKLMFKYCTLVELIYGLFVSYKLFRTGVPALIRLTNNTKSSSLIWSTIGLLLYQIEIMCCPVIIFSYVYTGWKFLLSCSGFLALA